jgi:uncharacterized protein
VRVFFEHERGLCAWLKGKATGIADTRKPLHLFMLGANRWIDSATYPLTDRGVSFQLAPGTLSAGDTTGPCESSANADAVNTKGCSATLLWAPEFEAETVLSFESAPLSSSLIIGGPGDVTIYLKSSRPEVQLTATLIDVAPDGSTVKITDGALLGSHRALDSVSSWYSDDGKLLRPSHFFTKEKSSAIPVGQAVRLDIELTPSIIEIAAGHRLRLRLASEPAGNFHQF